MAASSKWKEVNLARGGSGLNTEELPGSRATGDNLAWSGGQGQFEKTVFPRQGLWGQGTWEECDWFYTHSYTYIMYTQILTHAYQYTLM